MYSRKKSIYIPNEPYIIKYVNKKEILIKKSNNKIKFLSLARDDISKNLNRKLKIEKFLILSYFL